MEITEFVTARLDEDEVRAERALEEWADPNHRHEWEDLPDASYAHARNHDPARVLREVAAKRAILARYLRAAAVTPSDVSSFTRGKDSGYAEACLDAVRDLAAAWSDHPDYLAAWATSAA